MKVKSRMVLLAAFGGGVLAYGCTLLGYFNNWPDMLAGLIISFIGSYFIYEARFPKWLI